MITTDKYVLFWGGEFSNFYPTTIKYNKLEFQTSEHLFMYFKAMTFNDVNAMNRILEAELPEDAKAIGREVTGYNDDHWAKVRYDFMLTACKLKFEQNDYLRKVLLKSGDLTLVEASPYDRIWGVGLGIDHPDVTDETKWRGQNLLGKVLMEVREYLVSTTPTNPPQP